MLQCMYHMDKPWGYKLTEIWLSRLAAVIRDLGWTDSGMQVHDKCPTPMVPGAALVKMCLCRAWYRRVNLLGLPTWSNAELHIRAH